MAKGISLELIGSERLQRSLSLLEREVFPKANARAINRTTRKLRTKMIRTVAQTMGVVQRSVRSRTTMTAATEAKPFATLRFKGKAFNLASFKSTRQVREGVSAAPWGNRRVFRHGFIVTINGARLVMRRIKRGGELVPRMPIRTMLGPGIAKTAAEDQLREERETFIRDEYPKQLEGQLDYLVGRALKRR